MPTPVIYISLTVDFAQGLWRPKAKTQFENTWTIWIMSYGTPKLSDGKE